MSRPCTEHTHVPEAETRGREGEAPPRPAPLWAAAGRGQGQGQGQQEERRRGCLSLQVSRVCTRPASCSVSFPPQRPPFLPSPSTEGLSFSSFFLERSPQAIYINMFVTDAKIYTFFCLIKMFKLELAYCLWISRFC